MEMIREWRRYVIAAWMLIPGLFVTMLRLFRTWRNWAWWSKRHATGETYPQAYQSAWIQHVYVVANGKKIHGITASPGQAHRAPLMLCCHGFPECAWSYRAFLAAFKDSHYVVAIDMPGYGESGALSGQASWSRAGEQRLQFLASDIREVIRELGYDSAVLVGHDLGGMVSWAVASAYPEAIDQLIVMNCPHPRAFAANITLTQILRSMYIAFFQLPWLPELYLSSGDYRAVFAGVMGRKTGVRKTNGTYAPTLEDIDAAKWAMSRNLTAALNYYRNIFTYNLDAKSSSEKNPLDMPVLQLWGAKDAFLGQELMQRTARYCTPTTYREKIFPEASHWLQQDEVEGVVREVADFLSVTLDVHEALRPLKLADEASMKKPRRNSQIFQLLSTSLGKLVDVSGA